MSVNYKDQYRPDQLEPFWPNEIVKMTVVVLCTLAVIMLLAILPVLLESLGLTGVVHQEEPANPQGATPVGIKPEWYFLAVYQYLRLMPTQFLGISGKTWGVLSQGPLMLLVVLLPLWYRRGAHARPTNLYRLIVTVILFAFLIMTIWGGWPETVVDGHEQLAPAREYFSNHALMFLLMGLALIVFYVLIAKERRASRRVLHDESPPSNPESKP